MKRRLPGGTTPVNHIVFSDGVAALSVFIEAGSEKAEPGPSQRGALNVYTRVMAGHTVRVLGEVPPVTVRQVADNISFSGG
jgi:sigma-E factor negative regulatory protein RseB